MTTWLLMNGSVRRFATTLTADEEAFGLHVIEPPTGVRAIVRDLPFGLHAVKVQTDAGETEYTVCDDELQPLYTPAKSLFELHERFADDRDR